MIRVNTPLYYYEARLMYSENVPVKQIAKKFGVHPNRIYQIVGPAWERYVSPEALERSRKHYEERKAKEGDTKVPDRIFEKYVIPSGASDRRPGLVIRCKCGKTTKLRSNNILHPSFAAKKFKELGWTVGAGPNADRCPDCTNGLGAYKPPVPNGKGDLADKFLEADAALKAALKETAQATLQPPSPPEPVKVGEAQPPIPTEMTRADRRIIHNKIHEVYGDSAYIGDWSDAKVASNLGVPESWVMQVRTDAGIFGPNTNGTEEMRKVAEALDARLLELFNSFSQKIAEARKEIEKLLAA